MNILVLSSSDGITLSLLRCLGLMDAKSHVINIWNSANSSRLSRFCHHYLNYSVSSDLVDTDEVTAFINNYCDRNKIDVVIPSGLLGTFLIAKIRCQITSTPVFPGTTPENLYNLHNKWSFYNFLKKNEIPTPETRLLETQEQLNSLVLEFPVIVKPLSDGNSVGVEKIDSLLALEQYVSIADQNNKLPILIQDYIPGDDWLLNILADNGKIIAWTINRRTPYFFEFFKSNEVLEIAQNIVSVSHYSGVANFDIRFDQRNNSVKVIECNPRFWASFSASVYYGVDFVKLGILAAQKRTIPQHLKRSVSDTELFPYPTPNVFIKGLLRGKYFIWGDNKFSSDLAWQSVLDPLPNLYEKVWSRLGIPVGNDGEKITKLFKVCHESALK
jgi:predicted ATP-grasp superfamily ATP-dependent carboligase